MMIYSYDNVVSSRHRDCECRLPQCWVWPLMATPGPIILTSPELFDLPRLPTQLSWKEWRTMQSSVDFDVCTHGMERRICWLLFVFYVVCVSGPCPVTREQRRRAESRGMLPLVTRPACNGCNDSLLPSWCASSALTCVPPSAGCSPSWCDLAS